MKVQLDVNKLGCKSTRVCAEIDSPCDLSVVFSTFEATCKALVQNWDDMDTSLLRDLVFHQKLVGFGDHNFFRPDDVHVVFVYHVS